MDSDTLNTASAYLNNLLLARGLLRNGKTLDFAKPTRDTRAQIINLVHDLLLRRDRDQENREQIAMTLRALKTEQTRKDAELEKLQSRMAEKDRNLVQAHTETRNMKNEMKKMESTLKSLQEQLAKLKVSVGHIKTQCVNDVRKRDMHIERLKTHLQGQQRGNKGGVVAPMMNITGGHSNSGRSGQSFNMSVRDVGDPEYSLKQETNDFLTQLSQSLSDENDGLNAMLRGILRTMKDLLGLSKDSQRGDTMSTDLDVDADTSMVLDADDANLSYEVLATEVESTLEVLRTVLTSADFVSMEEVEQRDEEIIRLRDGWEMMEARWKEVVLMMNSWRTKMENGGDTINLDDLKKGLGLGEGLREGLEFSPIASPGPRATNDESEMASVRDSGIGHHMLRSQTDSKTKKLSNVGLEPPEQFHQHPLQDRHLRRMSPNIQSPRKVAFAGDLAKSSPLVIKEHSLNGASKNHPTADIHDPASDRRLRSQRSAPNIRRAEQAVQLSPQRSHRDLFSEPDGELADQLPSSCLEEDPQDQLTVEEKLRAAQSEAERAASTMPLSDLRRAESSQIDLEIEDEISKLRSPAKKTKIKGRPRRRKSTLSPEELENLMLGSVGLE